MTASKNSKLIYFAIGVFFLVVTWEITSFFQKILFDLLVVSEGSPILLLWSDITVQILMYSFTFFIGIKYLLKSKNKAVVILRNLILLFVLILILATAYIGIIQESIQGEEYFNHLENYYDYRKENYKQLYGVSILGFLTYAVPALIIYYFYKKNVG